MVGVFVTPCLCFGFRHNLQICLDVRQTVAVLPRVNSKYHPPTTMDILGSILSKMDKPPTMNTQEKIILQKQKQDAAAMEQKSKNILKHFRIAIESKIEEFALNNERSCVFDPMDSVQNYIIQDVAETAGLQTYSFGIDGSDRYSVVYRREFGPSQEELAARRAGDPWDDKIAAECAARRSEMRLSKDEPVDKTARKNKRKQPEELTGTHYQAKYVHLIGDTAALDAAKKTSTNKSYGEVPSENKKDQRSIEQTMADIQAKRQMKSTDKKN